MRGIIINPQHPAIGARAYSHYALLLLFIAACAAFYAAPLWDSDFWWHIASGRDILQHGRLPDVDPFGVFGSHNVVSHEQGLLSLVVLPDDPQALQCKRCVSPPD